MRKLWMLVIALVLVAGGAAAFEHGVRRERMHGGMHGGGYGMSSERHFDHIAEKLELTAAQREAAKKLHQDVSEKSEALRDRMHAAHDAMEELFESANPDPTALGQRMLEARAARQELETLHEATMAEFKKLLDATQLAELEKLHSERGRMRMRHGAGHPDHDEN